MRRLDLHIAILPIITIIICIICIIRIIIISTIFVCVHLHHGLHSLSSLSSHHRYDRHRHQTSFATAPQSEASGQQQHCTSQLTYPCEESGVGNESYTFVRAF